MTTQIQWTATSLHSLPPPLHHSLSSLTPPQPPSLSSRPSLIPRTSLQTAVLATPPLTTAYQVKSALYISESSYCPFLVQLCMDATLTGVTSATDAIDSTDATVTEMAINLSVPMKVETTTGNT